MDKCTNGVSVKAIFGLIAVLLFGCDEPAPEAEDPVRAIKTYTVVEPASGRVRRLSGVVAATDSTTLSFQLSGNVQAVNVELGDPVAKGQIIARLDPRPYELNLQAAQADLQKAEAALQEKQLDYERQRTLYEKDWISRAALDQSYSAYESAYSSVEYAQAKVNIAKRDLDNTVLRAPFDGVVAARMVEPYTDVQAGQPLFEINTTDALEVEIAVPETILPDLVPGMPATVTFPRDQTRSTEGRITKIGRAAESANAFPVSVALLDPPPGISPGMTALVSLTLGGTGQGGETAYLVPLSAIAPGESPQQGYVFRYRPETETVEKVSVRGRGVRDNFVEIYEGVAPGDVLAAAGVTFLVDGQSVKLMTPAAGL